MADNQRSASEKRHGPHLRNAPEPPGANAPVASEEFVASADARGSDGASREGPAGAGPVRGEAVPGDAVGVLSPNLERTCLLILTGLALFYTLYFTRALLLPATLAFLMNLVLQPIGRWLGKRGLPNYLSAGLIVGLLLLMVLVGVTSLAGPANAWLADAPRQFREVGLKLRSHAGPFARLEEAREEVDKLTSISGEAEPLKVQVEQPALATHMVNSTGAFFTGAIITFTLLFFLLASGNRFMEKTVELIPTWRGKRDVVALFQEIQHEISSYLGAITLINMGLGIVIGGGLWLIGMPNPLLWGVAAALLNYIPLAGLIVGTCVVTVVALTTFATLGHALLAPAIYLTANSLEANLVTPTVLGRSASLNPVVVMLAIFVGGWIWGVGGIFLAVPMLLVLKLVCSHHSVLEPWGAYLSP